VKLWVALLSRGVSTAGELSDIADVPRSRTYDVLESLEKKGFIIMKIGKPIKYLAIEPERVIDVIKKHIQEDADAKTRTIENVKTSDVLKELQLLHTQGIEHVDSADLSGSIKGRQNLYSHLEATIANAEKSVEIMTTAQGFIDKVGALLPVIEKVTARGVTVRIATQITEENKEFAEIVARHAQVRDTPTTGRFVCVDGNEILIMVLDNADVHPTYDVGIWVNTPFFAQTLKQMFDIAWKTLKEVKAVK